MGGLNRNQKEEEEKDANEEKENEEDKKKENKVRRGQNTLETNINKLNLMPKDYY